MKRSRLKIKVVLKRFLLIVVFANFAHIYAQSSGESVSLAMGETGAYSILERADWQRYDNGKYTGLVRHELRASIFPIQIEEVNDGVSNKAFLYQGNFFVLQSTLRDMRHSAQPVDAVIPVSFKLYENGFVVIEDDQGYPALRGFPAFPSGKVRRGTKWQANGSRALDPLNLGKPLLVPILAEYEYQGIEQYKGISVHRINALYAVRSQGGSFSASSYARVQGSHKVDILLRTDNGLPLFMRDTLDETYTMTDGSTVRFKGFTLTFGEGIIPMDRPEVIANLEDKLKIERRPGVGGSGASAGSGAVSGGGAASNTQSGTRTQDRIPPPAIDRGGLSGSSIDLTPIPEGIKLTVKNIQFIADSADFLPEERPRLDLIAEALKQIPNRTFLVEGHTASTGRPEAEMKLSIERAKRMVDELVKRGISADRFIYKGWGATRPIGDNAANRRVEITILE